MLSSAMILTAATSNLIILFIYTFLFYQYRQPYLKKWLAAWTINLLRLFIERYYYTGTSTSIPAIIDIVISAINISVGFLIIAGTVEFAGRKLAKRWSWAAIIGMLLLVLLRLTGSPFVVWIIPSMVYVGLAYIFAGTIFWQLKCHVLSKKIAAIVFVVLGVHFFDQLFLLSIPWAIPWGFYLDNILKILAALSISFIYLEKERNEVESAKDELEKYYKLLEGNTVDVIYLYNMVERKFEYISPIVKQLTGYRPDHYKGVSQIFRSIHPADRELFIKFVRGAYEKTLITMRIIRDNGEIVWVEPKYSCMKDAIGKKIAVEGIVRNVTSRIQLEHDRLDIAGGMAVSFADEVRQPLTAIKGFLQLMAHSNMNFEKFNRNLPFLMEEIDRTNDIITNLLTLSKNKRLDAQSINLNDIIKSVHPFLKLSYSHTNTEIHLNLNDIPNLWLDEEEVKKAIIHLVRNSVESMPRGGNVSITTIQKGRSIILAIRDEGKGMPPNILENIGKPFVTTKSMGNGLGLAFCYRIAQRHNAKIDIETGPKGTTVFLNFIAACHKKVV